MPGSSIGTGRAGLKSGMRMLVALVLMLLGSVGTACAAPSIGITSLPPYGVWGGYLQGQTLGADPAAQRVAVYIFIPNVGWYSKPYFEYRCTEIQPDGSWSCLVTTGGVDDLATIFAAFLVPNSACTDDGILANGVPCLPERVFEVALDHDVRLRENPDQRKVSFAGYEWLVKTSPDVVVGPGPNFFSDSTDNVWVDDQGRLHLKITYQDGKWQCAEVICRHPLGYGTYRFYLDSPVDDLDPNVVLGLFTYSDECPAHLDGCISAHREMDFEFTRWGDPNDPLNAQFVVQEFDCTGHRERFIMPSGATQSVHAFSWGEESIRFTAARGHSRTPAPADVVHDWMFAKENEVPAPGLEQTHINLYLMNGMPPLNGLEREVIINDFEFATTAPLAKRRSDGTPLALEGRAVTAASSGWFYVEEDDRSAGLRIEKADDTVQLGVRADVFGHMATNTEGERYLSAVDCPTIGTGSVRPLGLPSQPIGGGDFFARYLYNVGQAGVSGGLGLNNIGLLIRTWGKVTQIGDGYLYIDDGSKLRDSTLTGTEENIGVRVICDPTGHESGDLIQVNGISSCFKTGDGLARRILATEITAIGQQ